MNKYYDDSFFAGMLRNIPETQPDDRLLESRMGGLSVMIVGSAHCRSDQQWIDMRDKSDDGVVKDWHQTAPGHAKSSLPARGRHLATRTGCSTPCSEKSWDTSWTPDDRGHLLWDGRSFPPVPGK